MDVFEAIRTRRSTRKYKPDAVENEKLSRILEAVRLSPSAANKQPWHFIVVTDPEKKEKLRQAYNRDWFVSAPLIIVACGNPEDAWVRGDGEEYWKVDVAIAFQNLVLAAHAEGFGSCWIGAFNERAVKSALEIPGEIKVLAMTPLGVPAEEKGPVSDRKSLEKILHYNGW